MYISVHICMNTYIYIYKNTHFECFVVFFGVLWEQINNLLIVLGPYRFWVCVGFCMFARVCTCVLYVLCVFRVSFRVLEHHNSHLVCWCSVCSVLQCVAITVLQCVAVSCATSCVGTSQQSPHRSWPQQTNRLFQSLSSPSE